MYCSRCEKPMEPGHRCHGLNRRHFFLGLLGASSALLAARLDGIPIPWAGSQVRLRTFDRIIVDRPTVIEIGNTVKRPNFHEGMPGRAMHVLYPYPGILSYGSGTISEWVDSLAVVESDGPYRVIRAKDWTGSRFPEERKFKA